MVVTVDVKHVYKYPMDQVIRAHLNKYPTEKEKHVTGIRTVSHTRDIKTNTLYWRRIATCVNVLPVLLRKASFLKVSEILLEEECWWKLQKNVFSVKSRNVTWADYAHLEESSTFKGDLSNPSWTVFEQTGRINIHSLGSFAWMLEIFAKQFLNQGIKKSIKIMEDILEESHNQDFTHNMKCEPTAQV